MTLTSDERLQQVLSSAMEQRGSGTMDLVSNSNVLLKTLKNGNQFQTYSGPRIRETLIYAESGTVTRYSYFGYLNPKSAEILGDAEWTPKQAAASVAISGTELLGNSGRNQIRDIMKTRIEACEKELADAINEDLHSDGTSYGGEQMSGLQAAIPTDPTTGTYGSISRADNAIWRTNEYDISADFSGLGISTMTKDTVREIYAQIVRNTSRGRDGPNLVLASENHFGFFEQSLTSIQRITTDGSNEGVFGFPSLKFYTAGKKVDVVLEGGIGTAMPADISYFIDTKFLKLRYHPDRNFKPFGGRQRPVNQDAIVQHMGFMGELTMCNPLFMSKLYD